MLKSSLLCLLLCLPSLVGAVDKERLQTLLATEDLPGLRAAIVQDGQTIAAAAIGLADLKNDTPLDSDIGMPGGSTGKTFVAALTMLLVEEGVLSLDDPINKWVGQASWIREIEHHEDIQVKHLLSHSAGLSDYPGSLRFQSAMIWRVLRQGSAYFTPEELIGYAGKRGSEFLPGQGYRYTDAGYLVLGQVIEAASGKTYYELLNEKVLEPNQLTDIKPAINSALPDIAVGYQGKTSVLKEDGRMKLDPRSEWTGGGLVTTPLALARFHQLLASGQIVSTDSYNTMIQSGWQTPEQEWHYGFGLFVNVDQGHIEHGGLWPGYRTHVRHLLESKTTIVVQTNQDTGVDLPSLLAKIQAEL